MLLLLLLMEPVLFVERLVPLLLETEDEELLLLYERLSKPLVERVLVLFLTVLELPELPVLTVVEGS